MLDLRKAGFTRHVLTLMTGSTLAQAIVIASTPILTRIYTPEDFGLVAIYMSLASFLSLAATGRYEMAILLAKEQQESDDLTLMSIVIAVSVALISLCIVIFLNQPISHLVGNEDISEWLYFIPISVLCTGFYQSFNYWLTRKKAYMDLSKGRVIGSLTNVSISTLVGLTPFTINGLIIGNVFSTVTAALFYFRRVCAQGFYPNLNGYKARYYLKKHYKFPVFQLPNALIDGARQSVINILIGRLFGVGTLGFYALALKMLMLPTSLVGSAIGQVFYQKISEMHNDGKKTYSFVMMFILKTLFLSLPCYIILYYFAVDLFRLFFGEDWAISGEIVQKLIPWFYLTFVSSTISTLFIVFGRQRLMLVLSFVYLLIPIFCISSNTDNFFRSLDWMCFGMSCVLVIMIILALVVSYRESEKLTKLKASDEI